MKSVLYSLLVGLGALLALSLQANATNLPVANPSFEANQPAQGDWIYEASTGINFVRAIENWTYTFDDGHKKGTAIFTTEQYPAGVPDGSNVAYVNAGPEGAYIDQVVQGTALIAGHIYTLQVYVGNRSDLLPGVSYGMQLLAGGNLLAEMYDTIEQPGTFELASLQYTPQADNAFLGSPLEIKLWSFGDQTNFDEVSLTNDMPVPIPGSAPLFLSGLLGLSALGWRRRKN